jgi:glucose/arabinose dehydrogenase
MQRRTAGLVMALRVVLAAFTAASATAAPQRRAGASLQVPAANRSGAFTSPRTLQLPGGWTAEVWALVPHARLETWTPEGDLLVSAPADGAIYRLVPHHGDPSAPPSRHTVVSGLDLPQGMAFDRVGGKEVLYVAETDEIDRYVWRTGRATDRTVLVGHLPSGSDHIYKNVVVNAEHDLFFDIGSTANATPPPAQDPPWASVMEYAPSGKRIRVWATGVRNGDGLSFAPDGSLWTAVNGRDEVAFPFHRAYGGEPDAYGKVIPAYVDNHPPDQIGKLTPGRNLGWPFCNPDPDIHLGSATTGFAYGSLPFDRDVETNAGGDRLNCAKLPPLERGIPAHSAPLGLHFLEDSTLPAPFRHGAVVAVHGSWDRRSPRAPGVLWMPWKASRATLGGATTLVGGFQDASGARWGRTVDAVPGPDGALYVSDDTAGAIYRIVPR